MIKRPTVFILGAGASMPYNYPSGKQLVDAIVDNLLNKRDVFRFCSALEFKESEISKFAEALKFSGDSSIDAFLERNSEFLDLGKVAITLSLIKRENTDQLFSDGEDKWYRDLVNELKSPSPNDFKNEVSFLTFNYDRSFDHFLYVVIKNSYGISDKEPAELAKTIPIIHLHGQIGKLPWQDNNDGGRTYDNRFNNFSPLRTIIDSLSPRPNPIAAIELSTARHAIRRLSNQIKIIHEADIDKDVEFKEAHRLLNKAERIYFLGFGYNDENLKRLKIAGLSDRIIYTISPEDDKFVGRIIAGTNYGIGEAKKKHIRSVSNGKINLPAQELKILEFIKKSVDFD